MSWVSEARCAIHEINSLPACLIGGLWALQRQWLRQREQTAGERELGWMNGAERKKGNGVEWTQRKAILFHQSIFMKLIEEKNAAASAREWNEMEGRSAAQSGLNLRNDWKEWSKWSNCGASANQTHQRNQLINFFSSFDWRMNEKEVL